MNKSSNRKKTLIIGSGKYAVKVAENLASENIETVIISSKKNNRLIESEKIKIISEAEIFACKGTVGNFQLSAKIKDKEKIFEASEIIIAEDTIRKPNFADYGLSKTSAIISLSELKNQNSFEKIQTAVFVTGIKEDSNPIILKEIMQASLSMAKDKVKKIYILAKNLKVAANNLEALYSKTKKAGVIYFKFTDTTPEIVQSDNKKSIINCTDEISMQNFTITPDIIITDEKILPSQNIKKITSILRLDTDENGFAQADNVCRFPVFTNRKGIFAIGTSRKTADEKNKTEDIHSVILEILNLRNLDINVNDKAEINTDNCIYCLTCYRLCNHKAVVTKPRPQIIKEACEECGLCIAECPKQAIQFVNCSKTSSIIKGAAKKPFITAFCCTRSAGSAIKELFAGGTKLPQQLKSIEVPCAGSVSIDKIYSEFKKGASGVILLTCYEGNCYSEIGNIYANKRVQYISEFFNKAGIGKEKIALFAMASNMSSALIENINKFIKKISA
ncbi:MAG: hydrogenase iron-sulfur subunit [Deltaproteobacteria bacterium]|nr:hydrogenase iron-sulfur subunit [Deltaproteobacteria bacterium]